MKRNISSNSKMSLFGFFTLTAAMLMSADEYPAFAQSGLLAVLYLVLAGLLWFLPIALCSAEMATVSGWEEGGVYAWVKNTLGKRAGFIAVFFQWLQITVNFITMIYFIIGVLSFTLDLSILNTNHWLKWILFLIIYWAMTFFQMRGINGTDKLVKNTFIWGILLPAFILLAVCGIYLSLGNPLQFNSSLTDNFKTLTNTFSISTIVPFILAFTGIEASASYINNLRNPKVNYPLTLIILVLFAIIIDSFGGLSVASVVPLNKLSLNQGMIDAISIMFTKISKTVWATWMIKIVGLLMAFGMLGEISSWIIGPVKSLLATAEDRILPAYFDHVNEQQVTARLVIFQGIIVSVISGVLTVGFGGNNDAYKMSMSMTVMLYLVTYILIFIGYLALTASKKTISRKFKIPGGKITRFAVAVLGLISSLAVFASTFVPSGIKGISLVAYVTIMLTFFILIFALTLLIYSRRARISKRNYKLRHKKVEEVLPFTYLRGRAETVIEDIEKDISEDKHP
ncbi:MAG: amino acid permease [Oenococcus oeni]